MKRNKFASIEVSTDIEDHDKACTFAEDQLKRASISKEIIYETTLVLETILDVITMQDIDPTTVIVVSAENRLDGISLKIRYKGKLFALPEADGDIMSPELRILEAYADKISQTYRSGYNSIRISVRKSPRDYILPCSVGVLTACAVYAIINMFVDANGQQTLLKDYVLAFEQLFANAMLMVGAPVTFFSLLKNASDAVIISEDVLDARKIHVRSIGLSVFAILLALGLSFVITCAIADWWGYGAQYAGGHVEMTFTEMIVSMVPASIFEPFEVISPVPLIAVALLVTYALCSAGSDFDVLKKAIDVCYRLFSRMLTAVMILLPVASFLAVLDALLRNNLTSLSHTVVILLLMFACTFVLLATYAMRLKAKGVKVIPFAKKLMPLIRENHAIGSVIDAVPYNVRYCVRNYGMDRGWLSRMLPVLAQVNRDGNCFFLMLIGMFYIFASGTQASAADIVVIAALTLFLSLGAPNQPGSILIGTLIILIYLNASDMVCMAIYLEVFFGGMQNLVNVISDIVSVAEEQ